jgi:hypothetical protein
MNSVEAMNSDVCELGQYYTDRKSVTYMCKKISIKDNEVLVSIFDLPWMTSGFSTMNNDNNKNETTTNSN